MVTKQAKVQNPNEGYRFKKPRNINWVSLLMLAAGAFGVYLAVQFLPVYWKRYRVDRALQEAATQADSISLKNPETQRKIENETVSQVYSAIQGLGITTVPVEQGGNGLIVHYDQDYKHIQADYTVIIKHPFGKRTVLKFHRSEKVPTNEKFKR